MYLEREDVIMSKENVKLDEEVVEEVLSVDNNIEIATNLNISEDVIGIIAGLAASEGEAEHNEG